MDLAKFAKPVTRVLVVEDDPVAGLLLQRTLSRQGISVDRAADGEIALRMHCEQPYRLVISDWMMPQMDGVELCRAFRELQEQYVYFILCSAKGERADRLTAFEAGVDDILSKPLDQEELHARLNVAQRILACEEDLQNQKSELQQSSRLLQEVNDRLTLVSRRFEELFNGLPVASFTFDTLGRIQEWNVTAQEVFNISSCSAKEKTVWEVLNKRGFVEEWSQERVTENLREGSESSFDWTYEVSDGGVRYLACNVICLRDREGLVVGALCANLDVTERKRAERQANELAARLEQQKAALEHANERLRHLAVTDGLTALSNHRQFQNMLDEALHALYRDGEAFSLILLDIDHFKKLNDEFGHQAGDDTLVAFASTLQKTARSNELPARYGGEEFAIILRNCGQENAILAAERFRSAVIKGPWNLQQVTCSLGVATASERTITSREVVAHADSALYYSKQHGRNCSTHFAKVLAEQNAA